MGDAGTLPEDAAGVRERPTTGVDAGAGCVKTLGGWSRRL